MLTLKIVRNITLAPSRGLYLDRGRRRGITIWYFSACNSLLGAIPRWWLGLGSRHMTMTFDAVAFYGTYHAIFGTLPCFNCDHSRQQDDAFLQSLFKAFSASNKFVAQRMLRLKVLDCDRSRRRLTQSLIKVSLLILNTSFTF